MKRKLLIVFLLFLGISASAQDTIAHKLDRLITAYRQLDKFNGTALIADRNGILLAKGYGYRDFKSKLPNDTSTIFAIASVTKTFTSAMVLELVRLHKVALTDRLAKWYPHFPHADKITITELLSHTSGIYDYTRSADHGDLSNEAKMMAFLAKQPLDFTPGSEFRYSNSGYSILGFIIARVTGKSYEQAIRKYLFKPAGMTRSTFDSKFRDSNQAIGYEIGDTTRTAVAPADSATVFAAGAIRSTVGDLYRWHLALEANRFAGRVLLEQAYTRVHGKYGYGWDIDSIGGRKVVYHSGNIGGFCSILIRVPEDDVCIVLLNNQGGTELEGIARQLLDVVYHRPYRLPAKKTAISLPDSMLNRYAGTYDVPAIHAVLDISAKTGVLVVHLLGGPTFGFSAESASRFFFNDGESVLEFHRNAAGKMEIVIYQNNQKVIGVRRN
ncbi:MAG: serine hydrolase [Bacteroidetes bacterium]|nr:serine hydrolase [Bacteroidota bacterium]